MIVVLGTLKAHVSGIYSKMDVGNRVQAISRGRSSDPFPLRCSFNWGQGHFRLH
ncbi:MAG: response regulator transcription factor [Chloroflexi bacterium]|nr:response regulator transcription factor [Chloroflexota bacterium]